MHPPAAFPHRLDLKRRAASSLLSLAAVGLIVLALLRLGVARGPEPKPEPNSFTLSPEPEAGPRPSPEAAERRADAAAPPERAAAEPVQPETPVPPPPPVPAPPLFPDILILNKEEFAASDIGRMRSMGKGRSGEEADGGGTGADSVAAYGPGEGPGGQRLFNAEWYREPSRAELAGYLPPGGAPPGSWAIIACRTIERYEVENCRTLGESPAGSGLGRAMRRGSSASARPGWAADRWSANGCGSASPSTGRSEGDMDAASRSTGRTRSPPGSPH